MTKTVRITDEALDDLVTFINTAKSEGVSDVAACISANRDELRISVSYDNREPTCDVKTITINLQD